MLNGSSHGSFAPNSRYITGLYIQYGIVKGYESQGEVQLSYFDEDPLEPRYYMFGRYHRSF